MITGSAGGNNILGRALTLPDMSLTSIRWCTLVIVDGYGRVVVSGGAPVGCDRSDHAPPVIYTANGSADGPGPAPVIGRGRGNGAAAGFAPVPAEPIWTRLVGRGRDVTHTCCPGSTDGRASI